MRTFNGCRPQKLEEHGDQLVSVDFDLLATHGAQLSQSKRNKSQKLLEFCVCYVIEIS
jgi:hypothetical protein